MKKLSRMILSPALFVVVLVGVGIWAEHENPHGPTVQDCERMREYGETVRSIPDQSLRNAKSFTAKQLADMGC